MENVRFKLFWSVFYHWDLEFFNTLQNKILWATFSGAINHVKVFEHAVMFAGFVPSFKETSNIDNYKGTMYPPSHYLITLHDHTRMVTRQKNIQGLINCRRNKFGDSLVNMNIQLAI